MNVPKRNDRNASAWLTPEEFGEAIPGGLGAAAVRKWARQGRIPGAIQLPNGRWQIPDTALDALMEGIEAS